MENKKAPAGTGAESKRFTDQYLTIFANALQAADGVPWRGAWALVGSRYSSKPNNPPINREGSFRDLIADLLRSADHAEKEGPGICGCTFGDLENTNGGLRHGGNITGVHVLGFDLEHLTKEAVEKALKVFSGTALVAYSSWKHGVVLEGTDQPDTRFRILVPLSRSITKVEHGVLWRHYADRLTVAGVAPDEAAKAANNVFYSIRAQNPSAVWARWLRVHVGQVLNPDSLPTGTSVSALLAAIPPKPDFKIVPIESHGEYAPFCKAALEKACLKLSSMRADCGQGVHNTLLKEARSIGGLIWCRAFDFGQALEVLTAAGVAAGLSEQEARETAQDGLENGQEEPRHIDPAKARERSLSAVNKQLPSRVEEEEEYRRVELVNGSSIQPENIRWLWRDWLAKGKLHILGGAPGCGKTTLAMVLAATVSSGCQWPDGSPCECGNVVIWTGEDDPADTLIPRLILSGADLKRVNFINGVVEGEEKRSFDPAHDVALLAQTLSKAGNVRLLIVDPIVSAISGDSHKNAEVRRGLQGLVDLAREIGCALVGITHLSKGTQGREPLERITGSLAFGALTRIAWVAVKPQPDEEGRKPSRLFLRVKSNIGPDGGGFEYDLQQGETESGVRSSYALWGKSVDGDARAILSDAEAVDDDGEGGALSHAKNFLHDLLENGPLVTKAIEKEAKEAGYSWATIRRAQTALGIRPAKDVFNGPWKWALPKMLKNTEDAQEKEVEQLRNSEQLGQLAQPSLEDAQLKNVSNFGNLEQLREKAPGFHYGPTIDGMKEVIFDDQAPAPDTDRIEVDL